MKVKFKLLYPSAKVPTRAHTTDAGLDLYVSRCGYEDGYWVCHSDVAFEIPEGHVGLLFPRSSIYKHGHQIMNSVGVIDCDYRGEVKAVLNHFGFGRKYQVGDRFAQLVIIPIPAVELVQGELSDTERGSGGYGSTGN